MGAQELVAVNKSMTGRDLYVDQPLTDIAISFFQENPPISLTVFPSVGVVLQGGTYWKYNMADILRDEAALRAPGTEAVGIDMSVDKSNGYFCKVYALKSDITEEDRANNTTPMELERTHTLLVMAGMRKRLDRQWCSTFFAASVWSTEYTGGGGVVKWDDGASTPIDDIDTAMDAVHLKCGERPNTLVINPNVFTALKNNAQILARMSTATDKSVTTEVLARLFRVERVLVLDGVYVTSKEGATATTAYVAGKHALLCFAAPAPSKERLSAGYTFTWKIYNGEHGIRIRNYWMDNIAADRIQADMGVDMRVVCADAGAFFATIVD